MSASHGDDAMHEHGRRHDGFGVERADGHDLIHFDDGDFRRRGHDWIEISGGLAIDEIAERIGFERADQSEISAESGFENAAASVDRALFFSLRYFRTYTDGR